jgi:hypothetical protein
MKDVDESEKTPYGLIYDSLIKRHPMMFNAVLVMSLVTLTATAAFLVFDILSSGSNNCPAELFGVSSFLNPLKGEQIENPAMALANNSALKDAEMPQSSLNRSGTEKNSLSDDDSKTKADIKGLDNPSLNNTSLSKKSISSRQPAGAVKSTSKPLIDDSAKSAKKKKHRSSKSSNQETKGIASSSIVAGRNSSELNQSDVSSNNWTVDSAIIQGDEAAVVPMFPVSNPANNISNEPADLNPALNADGTEFNTIESQYPESDMTDDAKEPASIAETLTPTPLSGPDEDETVGSDLSGTQEANSEQEDNQVVPSRKFSSRSQDAEHDQINKRTKTAKGPKRTAPSAKPAKTRPARPARDRSRD